MKPQQKSRYHGVSAFPLRNEIHQTYHTKAEQLFFVDFVLFLNVAKPSHKQRFVVFAEIKPEVER